MKKLVNALTGKTAMMVVMVLAAIGTVLDIVTAFRLSTTPDYMGMCAVWVALAAWAAALESSKKKNAENK
ncbi:MAG: hypothetical protein K6A74_06120 [Lachnospiraceae bacterium]|nr:hypothetical protein [Lachnospiraceae bacterium]